MKIILNHTLRSMREHIGQPIVIVFTVAIVCALLFASSVMGNLFYNFQLASLSRVAGDTDVAVSGEVFSGAKLNEFLQSHLEEVEYVDTYFSDIGILNGIKASDGTTNKESTAVLVEATDLQVFFGRHNNKLFYYDGIKDSNYVYPGLWMGKALAEENGYKIGDEVTLYIGTYGRYESFTVTYIFENEGIFANTAINNILLDISSIGDKGLYTDAYIKLKSSVNKELFIEELKEYMDNPNLEIGYAVDYVYIERIVADNENLLRIALLFIVALVIFILFGAYTVVAKRRASELLVFKAAGATPLQMLSILLTEVVIYGLIGGVAGVIVGRFGMEVAVQSVIPEFSGAVVYKVWNYILSIFMGVVVSIGGAISPMIRLVRNSVRNNFSVGYKTVNKIKPVWILLPLAIFIGSIVCINYISQYAVLFTVILIVSSVSVIVMGAPYLMHGISYLVGLKKGSGHLAACGIKRNSEAVSLACLLGGVMAFVFITVSIVGVIVDATRTSNARFHADYAVQSISAKNDVEEINENLKNTYGVTDSNLLYYKQLDVNLNGRETDLTIYAVNSSKDLDCVCNLSTREQELFDNQEDAVVLSYDIMARLDKKIGDKWTIEIGDKEYTFQIIAKEGTYTANDRVAFINLKGCDFRFTDSLILLNFADDVSHSDLYSDLNEKLAVKHSFILPFGNWAFAASAGMDGIAALLKILQIIVGLVGLAGIINLTIAMMIARERELGIYRASGMGESGYFRLLLTESTAISCTGASIGALFSVSVSFLLPTFAKMIDRYVDINFYPIILILIPVIIIVYSVIYCFIGKRNKIKKINIERNSM